MSKKLIGIIAGIILLATSLSVYIVLGSINEETPKVNENSLELTDEAKAVDINVTQQSITTSNPFEEKVNTPLSELLIQQYIHAMSHQKVKAKEKWSFYEITDERINFLLAQLEVNNYKNEQLYIEILTSWKNGDFSNAANQHNAVWKLQEGTVGKASGLLSPKEEEAFLQSRERESR
ncbi:DUF6241 domain-containing protein [Rossellomorea aquimaris]|uniref:DUF6241 domain-containing protein n=1 Tax=Rossellomorea aquimaris TaxID=189382 RepID=UPI0007D0A421|nr:DUF6241 domain-containing protein [Rossellomorea aquimaris]